MKKTLCFLSLFSSITAFAGTTPSSSNPAPTCDGLKYCVDASFTYWYAKEDGLNIAESALLIAPGRVTAPPSSKILQQSFGYKPGFKVGIGLEAPSRWDLQAQYTYFRGTNNTNKGAPSNTTSLSALGVWNMDDWFLQSTSIEQQSLSGTHVSSKWKLAMDLGDLTLARPYKNKRGFGISPFGGLRTVWLRQEMNVYLTQAAASIGGSNLLVSQPLESLNSSHAWGIGPRIGTQGKYGLPMGFRAEGLIAATLLYTKFTSVKHWEQKASTLNRYPIETSMSNYNCVRPVFDVNLGIGWCTQFCQKYDVDLSASYEFYYFWGQNMMRTMLDEYWSATASGNNDLYFQGLTITAAFKF